MSGPLRIVITQPRQGTTLLLGGGGGELPEPGAAGWPADFPDAAALVQLVAIKEALLAQAGGAVPADYPLPDGQLQVLAQQVTLLEIKAQLATQLARLGDIFGAVDGLEVTAGNIAITSDALHLNTDGVEQHLREIRDRLPATLGQLARSVSLAVALSAEDVQLLTDLRARLPAALVGGKLAVDTGLQPQTDALTNQQLRDSPVAVKDDGSGMLSQHLVLTAGQNVPVAFAQPVRSIRIQNWDTANRVLVKTSAITSDTDASASRIGKAPAPDVPNSEFYGFVASVIHLRSAAASEVTVEGFL